MVGNTGTYLDSPFHRFPEAPDLAATRWSESSTCRWPSSTAVPLNTGETRRSGTPAYAREAPYLTGDGAQWLADREPTLVGIDAVNIDDLDDPARPAHTVLLGRGVLVLEHLTGLANVPATGARLHAAPPAWHGVGTWPVRAYAVIEEDVT